MTTELPPGWTAARLGDLVHTKSGNSKLIKGKLFSAVEPGLIPAYSASGQDVWCEHAEWEVDGVVLSAVGARCGKTFLARGQWTAIANTHVLIPAPGIDTRWLWYLTNNEDFWVKGGSAQPFVKMKLSKEMPVSVPPLTEQRRIVDAIDEHFSRLDAAENVLESAQQKVDALLRAVVNEVCRGSWDTVPLVEVTTSLRNGVFVSRPAPEPPGRPIYRISAVRPLRLRVNDIRYAHPVPDRANDYAVASGDLLFTRYSGNPSYVGAAAVVDEAGRGVLHPDKLIRVIADKTKVLPEWIAAYVSVGEGRRQVEQRLKTTAGQVGISGRQLKSVPIAVPPLDYQRSAAASIGAVIADQNRIEQQLTTLRAKMSALRRSVLVTAFVGRI